MSVNTKLTNLANEVREISGSTTKKSLDVMTADISAANDLIDEQESLLSDLRSVIDTLPEPGLDTSDATVTATAMLSGYTAYARGEKITGQIVTKSSANLTSSGATVTVPSGYYAANATKTISTGKATTPATTITANPTVGIDSSGKITATVSASKSITPTITAGYVSSGTAGTVTVSGSSVKQLSTKAAATYTPGTSNQTISSGTYLTGTQTIKGDSNLVAGNIKSGTSIFGVTGSYVGGIEGVEFNEEDYNSLTIDRSFGSIYVNQPNEIYLRNDSYILPSSCDVYLNEATDAILNINTGFDYINVTIDNAFNFNNVNTTAFFDGVNYVVLDSADGADTDFEVNGSFNMVEFNAENSIRIYDSVVYVHNGNIDATLNIKDEYSGVVVAKNLSAENIKSGTTILGVTGKYAPKYTTYNTTLVSSELMDFIDLSAIHYLVATAQDDGNDATVGWYVEDSAGQKMSIGLSSDCNIQVRRLELTQFIILEHEILAYDGASGSIRSLTSSGRNVRFGVMQEGSSAMLEIAVARYV